VKLERIDVPNISDIVYERLRDQIVHYEFAPGERLDLPALEEVLGVSRTPLKDALTRLEAEGLIEIQPRRGTFVTSIAAESLDEAYKIRSALELYVALCLFKYLTDEDRAFFRALRREMDKLVHDPRGWRSVIQEYLDLDRQLHERFIERGGPPRMLGLFRQVNVHMQVGRIIEHYHDRDLQNVHFEHERIYEALDSRSPEQLHASLLDHLEASRMRVFKNYPSKPQHAK
jgi:GntR family transcriptional regulator, rspAB operon transcriptional repressor